MRNPAARKSPAPHASLSDSAHRSPAPMPAAPGDRPFYQLKAPSTPRENQAPPDSVFRTLPSPGRVPTSHHERATNARTPAFPAATLDLMRADDRALRVPPPP